MTDTENEIDDECPNCGGTRFTQREDSAVPFEVRVACGRQQDGLGQLQDRFRG